MYKTYGELSTSCHHFDVICALVIKLNLVTSSVVKMYMPIKMYENTVTRLVVSIIVLVDVPVFISQIDFF